jgi:hypothetical protein
MNQNWVRVVAWASIAALFLITDGPIGLRPETGLPPSIERFLALLFVGAVFALAYPRQTVLVLVFLWFVIGVFELLQIFIGGRHAHLRDVMFKCAGASAGVSVAYVGSWLRRRWREP